MAVWRIDIRLEALAPIVSGQKRYEGRAPDGRKLEKDYRQIKAGDALEFYLVDENYKRVGNESVHIRWVEKSITFKNVEEACKEIDLEQFNPGVNTIKENVALYNSFPGYSERIKEYGFTRIKLKKSPVFTQQKLYDILKPFLT